MRRSEGDILIVSEKTHSGRMTRPDDRIPSVETVEEAFVSFADLTITVINRRWSSAASMRMSFRALFMPPSHRSRTMMNDSVVKKLVAEPDGLYGHRYRRERQMNQMAEGIVAERIYHILHAPEPSYYYALACI